MQDGSSPNIWMPQGRSCVEMSISSSRFLLPKDSALELTISLTQ